MKAVRFHEHGGPEVLRNEDLPVPEPGPGEAVGPGVTEVGEGERVGFWDAPGAYAEAVVHRAERLLPLPDGVGFEAGAALPLQGMTAHYLTHTIRPLSAGDTVLIHAAAGAIFRKERS